MAENKVSVTVSAEVLTAPQCVKLSPAQTYSDANIKGQEYIGVTQKSISITNYCNQAFSVGPAVLFSDVVGGGNFSARIDGFTIQPNQTLNIPVIYNGIYLGSNLGPAYMITINGNTNMYNLTVKVPVVNQPPVVTDIIIDLANRENIFLTSALFTAHFSDVDGDNWDAVIIEGNTSLWRLNGQPIVSGQEISRSDIDSGYLVKIAQDTGDFAEDLAIWRAKDTAGNISI